MGASPSSMELELFSVSDIFLQKMDDNEALLGSYPVDDNCKIHVCIFSLLKACLILRHMKKNMFSNQSLNPNPKSSWRKKTSLQLKYVPGKLSMSKCCSKSCKRLNK